MSLKKNELGKFFMYYSMLPQMGLSVHRLQGRTLSDELFAVPMQPSILDGIFSDDDAKVLSSSALETTSSVSGTDTENDSPDCPNGDDSDCDARLPSVSQSSYATESYLEDSYPALPLVVQEFREMFGNDESYPVDFPESLRL